MTRQAFAQRVFAGVLCAAFIVACGDDDGGDEVKDAGSTPLDSSVVDAAVVDANQPGDAGGSSACLSAVYSELSDGCSTCACGVDPQLAPACGRPCWDFLACSFKAQAGACATFAAGGAAMRPQFEACTMEECGAELAVPGAEVVSSYRSIIGACAVPMGSTPAACTADITKFTSELK